MATVKRSISITEQQNQWVKSQLASGDFGNESEVYRALIRKAQSEEVKLTELRAALRAGEKDIEAGRFKALSSKDEISAMFRGLQGKTAG